MKKHISKYCDKCWVHVSQCEYVWSSFTLRHYAMWKNSSLYRCLIQGLNISFLLSSLLLPPPQFSPFCTYNHLSLSLSFQTSYILIILSVCMFFLLLALLLSPAVLWPLCASIHPLFSLLLSFFSSLCISSVYLYCLYFHFFLCQPSFSSPLFSCLFIRHCSLPPISATARPLTSYPSLAEPNPPILFFSPSIPLSPLWTAIVDSFSLSLFHNFSPFSLYSPFPALSRLLSSCSFFLFLHSSFTLLAFLCLCGPQTYLPPRRQAAVGEVWKPALGRLSDLSCRASCLTSKGNE